MRRLTDLVRTHRLAAYVVLAYALSWSYWVPLVLAGRIVRLGGSVSQFPALVGPMIAALVVTAVASGRAGVRDLFARIFRWRVPTRWWLVAAGSPLALLAVALIAMSITGTVPSIGDFGRVAGLPPWGVLFVWAMFVIVNGLGEETGWRGFVYPTLREQHGWLATTLLVLPIWAGWHLPLFFLLQTYRDLGPIGVPGFLLGLACGSVVLGWLYESTGGSVLLAAVWHGTYNVTAATAAAHGTVAAAVSMGVMLGALALALVYRHGLPTRSVRSAVLDRGARAERTFDPAGHS